MSTVVQGILLAVIGVLLFGLIIFIHEFGHFFTAKLSHVCVNEFSIGMGPKLFSFTRGETQYSLRLLPIGGYCAMEGEDEKSDDPRAFGNRPVWQRMIVVAAGVDKIRINPGNIGGDDRVKAVATVCREKKIPIRIGVNSGSVEKSILAKYGAPTAEALCESALYHASLLEKFDFTDIVISLKSSSVDTNIKAYERIAERCDYPLHLGVTETGTLRMGIVKSAIGIGSLLQRGIGDTLRVSLTADPAEEIRTGRDILSALGLRGGVKLVSCPTCGRTRIDLIGLANKVEKALEYVDKDITVAVMGCVVNGPGEAREADLGVTGGKGEGLIFKKGQIIRKVPEAELLDALMEEIDKL